jgi:hypothetical protein
MKASGECNLLWLNPVEFGFYIIFAPFSAGKTDEFVKSTDEGEIAVWYYLVPRYELRNTILIEEMAGQEGFETYSYDSKFH